MSEVSLRASIHDGDKTVFGMLVKGKTIAQAAKLTALAYAETAKIDLWKDPVVRVQVVSNERSDELDIRLSVDAKWINPREGVED